MPVGWLEQKEVQSNQELSASSSWKEGHSNQGLPAGSSWKEGHTLLARRDIESRKMLLCVKQDEERNDQGQRAVPSQMRAIPRRIRRRSRALARRFRSRKMMAAQRKDMITELRRTRETTEIIESGLLNEV